MTISTNDILNAVAEMRVMDVVDLIEKMEQKFNVKASAMMAAAAPAAGPAAEVEEKTEFDVILTSFGANKVAVIKAIRTITSLGLKEAKDLVEAAPKPVKEAISKAECEEIKKVLVEAGAEVEIK